MSLLKSLGNFLFGKDPDIFDDKGQVLHKLPKRKWDDWNNRIIKGSEYNLREHTGHQAGLNPQAPTPTTSKK